MRRTIFISAYQGFASRYLLKGGLIDALLETPNLRIIVLVRDTDLERVEQDIGGDRVLVRRLAYKEIRDRHSKSVVGPRLSQIRLCVLDPRGHDGSAKFWLAEFLKSYRRLGPLHKFSQIYIITITWLLRQNPYLRKGLRWFESKLLNTRLHDQLFNEFKPCLVVVPSLGYFEVDSYLIREARNRGIPSIGIVVNWDHTTSKGTSSTLPDRALVWGKKMQDEVEIHHDMPHDAIEITGPAHYDHYFKPGTYVSRESFCSQRGLDPEKKIILYAAMSPRPYPYNPEIIELLAETCHDGGLNQSTQLFVRLHPNYHQLKFDKPEQWKTEYEKMQDLKARFKNLAIESPQVDAANKETFDLSGDDARTLANTLFHADLVVCFFSTLNLEAAIVDRPIVNCCIYDLRGGKLGKNSRVLEVSHLQNLIKSKSSQIIFNAQALRESIRAELEDPSKRRAARKAFVTAEISLTDGCAVERAAKAILRDANVSTI